MTNLAMKPRVHWVSPLPPAETDIGNYTARILPALAEVTDLTLWTDATKWDKKLERYAPVRQLHPDRVIPKDLTAAALGVRPEAVFIHIGNSGRFHSGLLRLARRVPSTIVLHDLAIQEMCFEAVKNNMISSSEYISEMERWHGQNGADRARKVVAHKLNPCDILQDMPGFHMTLDRASSVLTHTPAAFDALSELGMVPAYLLDLPFAPAANLSSSKRAASGPLKFVQFGCINPNRRLEEVIQALGPLKDRVDFEFDIFGNVWDPEHIKQVATNLGIGERIRIHGFVDEPQLDAALAQAHLVFNLRYPTMGEASGSQLRIWNAAAAAVVTDLGWYGSLPSDTVFQIPLDGEARALQELVMQLDQNRQLGAALGDAGQAWLRSHHTPEIYAAGIAEIACRTAQNDRSALFARRARQHLSHAVHDETGQTSSIWRDRLVRAIRP